MKICSTRGLGWLLVCLTLAPGCKPAQDEECRARCPRYGIPADGDICRELCGSDCEAYAREYGAERICAELRAPELFAEPLERPGSHADRSLLEHTPSAPEATFDPADLTRHCRDYIRLNFQCGIGLPAPDPTVDVSTQLNNELVLLETLTDNCEHMALPFEPELIHCSVEAGGDCERYRSCARLVVGRDEGERPSSAP